MYMCMWGVDFSYSGMVVLKEECWKWHSLESRDIQKKFSFGQQSLRAGVPLCTSSIAYSAGCTLHMHDPVTSTVLYSEH